MANQQEETRMDRLEKNIDLLFKGIYELKESQKLTDEQIRKTDEQLLELGESQKKTDEQLKKTDEQLRKTELMLNRTIKKLDDIGRQLGDLGLVQGEVAEDLFYRNVTSVFKKQNLDFERVRRNLKSKGVGEYDIVAEDGNQVLVIEVKNKLEKRMVDQFVNVKIRRFKDAFPRYRATKFWAESVRLWSRMRWGGMRKKPAFLC
jgi:Holliday junction resolvase-like predicted endonuclease